MLQQEHGVAILKVARVSHYCLRNDVAREASLTIMMHKDG